LINNDRPKGFQSTLSEDVCGDDDDGPVQPLVRVMERIVAFSGRYVYHDRDTHHCVFDLMLVTLPAVPRPHQLLFVAVRLASHRLWQTTRDNVKVLIRAYSPAAAFGQDRQLKFTLDLLGSSTFSAEAWNGEDKERGKRKIWVLVAYLYQTLSESGRRLVQARFAEYIASK
jgi:hypothetical protein